MNGIIMRLNSKEQTQTDFFIYIICLKMQKIGKNPKEIFKMCNKEAESLDISTFLNGVKN